MYKLHCVRYYIELRWLLVLLLEEDVLECISILSVYGLIRCQSNRVDLSSVMFEIRFDNKKIEFDSSLIF